MKLLRKSLFNTTLVLGLATGPFIPALYSQAIAAEKMSSSNHAIQGEFDNYCVMGLADGKRIKTDCTVSLVYEGKTYCFRNEDLKVTFLKDSLRNLERAKDHFSAGEVTQTGDDMGK